MLKKFTLPTWLPFAVLASGALLRLVGLTVSPIWFDEAFTLYLTKFPAQIVQIDYGGFTPPLWELVISPFVWLLGQNEWGMRVPALICSLGAMWLAWQIAKEFLSYPQWLPAAALIALLPYHFWMAQDGRAYAFLSLLYVATLYFGLHERWLGFSACMGLMCYTHSTGLFYAASACLGLLVLCWWHWRKILLAGLAAGLAIVPWLPSYFNRVGSHWLGPLNWDELLKAIYFSTFAGALPYVWAYGAIWLLIISIVAGLAVVVIRRERNLWALAIFWGGPLVFLLLVAIVKNLIFYRPLSAMLLPFCIWLPAALWPRSTKQWTWGGWVLPYLWCLALVVGLLNWNPGTKGGELRQLADMINQQWQPGDMVYHATGTSWLPMSLYLRDPGYVLDEEQVDGLLSTKEQRIFGVPRADLAAVPHQRAWVVWAKDVIMSPAAWARMQKYTAGATLVGTIHYWQAADIDVYLVEDK